MLLDETSLAIVDPYTGQIALQDLRSQRLFTPVRPPELDSALAQVERSVEAAKDTMKPGDPPLGRPMIIADIAVDQRGLYLLTWPYHPSTGPTVTRMDSEGRVTGRYQLGGADPKAGVLNEVEVMNGNRYLGSSRGSIYQYGFPN